MLDLITPVMLTYNEAANVGRTLSRLAWAKRIVLVDSFSDDGTVNIARQFPNVEVFRRRFDDHCRQWTYGVRSAETAIDTPWVLALDADYVLTPAVIEEVARLRPDDGVTGFRAPFRYCIEGRIMRGLLYPPVVVLYRPARTSYIQDGHTQRLVVQAGRVADLRAPILHDDRKPMIRWIQTQAGYARLEADKLRRSAWRDLGWADRLRRVPLLSTPLAFLYCLIGQGGILDGRPGLVYASQRAAAELLISLSMLERTADGQAKQ